jgi:hypothetical protein
MLRLSVRANLFPLRLRHDDGRTLGMRGCEACELHRRHRGRGKQQETKLSHVMSVPRMNGTRSAAINKYGLGRNVAALADGRGYISSTTGPGWSPIHGLFSRLLQTELPDFVDGSSERLGAPQPASDLSIRRGIGGARPIWSAPRHLVRAVARQFIRQWWLPGLARRRRYIRPRVARRALGRRLGRMSRGRRRDVGRLDAWRIISHHIATLRLPPMSGCLPVTTAAAILP